ncbi:hypothetical protein, partial [Cutibacterium acnes]|uniref:hypothetical protein n=1 Tax=Cutibacterium acnes TaxID=1747 RepID=UPI00191BCB58
GGPPPPPPPPRPPPGDRTRPPPPPRRYQLPSTGGDPAIGLPGIAGIVGLGAVITTTVTATHKSRR